MHNAISFGNNDHSIRFSDVRSNNFDAIDDEQKKKNASGPMSETFDYKSAFKFVDKSKDTKTAGFTA